MIAEKKAGHGQCASEHRRMDIIMMSEAESVELGVMVDKEHIGPILFFQDIGQLALVIPNRRRRSRPLNSSAVGLEARVADVSFRPQLGQRELVTKKRLKIKNDRP